jgi:hypothetical protein
MAGLGVRSIGQLRASGAERWIGRPDQLAEALPGEGRPGRRGHADVPLCELDEIGPLLLAHLAPVEPAPALELRDHRAGGLDVLVRPICELSDRLREPFDPLQLPGRSDRSLELTKRGQCLVAELPGVNVGIDGIPRLDRLTEPVDPLPLGIPFALLLCSLRVGPVGPTCAALLERGGLLLLVRLVPALRVAGLAKASP